MPNVINRNGFIVFRGLSDAECVRWWEEWGSEGDGLDTQELMSDVADAIGASREEQ
ncbi:MAG: hypothetical protein K0Q89_27 [Thermomicrobiales bacterium]|jgi:hypothetical protein|nr:hypothetical protein [Thermomicrobiales bacterium]